MMTENYILEQSYWAGSYWGLYYWGSGSPIQIPVTPACRMLSIGSEIRVLSVDGESRILLVEKCTDGGVT